MTTIVHKLEQATEVLFIVSITPFLVHYYIVAHFLIGIEASAYAVFSALLWRNNSVMYTLFVKP